MKNKETKEDEELTVGIFGEKRNNETEKTEYEPTRGIFDTEEPNVKVQESEADFETVQAEDKIPSVEYMIHDKIVMIVCSLIIFVVLLAGLWSKLLYNDDIKVGDYIEFGTYEQDNIVENGKEKIEWLVLDKTAKGKALVISKFALDFKKYNSVSDVNLTWQTSSLRKWLNSTFLNSAFSKTEKKRIVYSEVDADGNPMYDSDPGSAVVDKIFLLSVAEAYEYFRSDSARRCELTDYAFDIWPMTTKMDNKNYYKNNAMWWLRTPGNFQTKVAYVQHYGNIYLEGNFSYQSDCAVRPAMWIDLNGF